jgi:hypothetical protein
MISSHRRLSMLLMVVVPGTLMSGCTTTTTQSFNVTKNPKVEASSIAADADFGKYDRLYASEMGIYFPKNGAPSLDDQKRTRQIFRATFLSKLEGYDISREKGPSALDVQATLIDFRNASGEDVLSVRRELREIARPGAIMFLMELKDSQTGEVLARAADSASVPAFSTTAGTDTDWSAVETAAGRWATLFRAFLDDNLDQ